MGIGTIRTRVGVREPMVPARKQSGFLHDCIHKYLHSDVNWMDVDIFKTVTMTFRITFLLLLPKP